MPEETLRDKFAMAALSGIIARSSVDGFTLESDMKYHIRMSYEYADIAMAQREKSKQD